MSTSTVLRSNSQLSDAIRSEFRELPLHEILHRSPRALLGVTEDAEKALATLEIVTVFDLATSAAFTSAVRILEAGTDLHSAYAIFGAPTADNPRASRGRVGEPLEPLKGVVRLEDGIQVPNQQESRPGTGVLGDQVAGALERCAIDPSRGKAQRIEFLSEDGANLAHSGEVHRTAVDVDKAFEQDQRVRAVGVGRSHDRAFDGQKGVGSLGCCLRANRRGDGGQCQLGGGQQRASMTSEVR